MASLLKNIVIICLLTCFVLGGFSLLTQQQLAVSTIQQDEVMASAINSAITITYLPYSKLTVFLGVAGLMYLKIIWKLVTPPK